MPYAITWAVLAIVLPLISLAICLSLLPAEGRSMALLGHALFGGVFLCLLGACVWGMLCPDLKGETMGRAVLKIARRDRPDLGPHFFTSDDVKRMAQGNES
jgi:hypothetical protein